MSSLGLGYEQARRDMSRQDDLDNNVRHCRQYVISKADEIDKRWDDSDAKARTELVVKLRAACRRAVEASIAAAKFREDSYEADPPG